MADAKIFRDDERFADQVARALDDTRRQEATPHLGGDPIVRTEADRLSEDAYTVRDGSGMTRTNAPSDRVRFMEQERAEAWDVWAHERGIADRSTSGADYTAFIRARYDLDQHDQPANSPAEPTPASPGPRKWPEQDHGMEP